MIQLTDTIRGLCDELQVDLQMETVLGKMWIEECDAEGKECMLERWRMAGLQETSDSGGMR